MDDLTKNIADTRTGVTDVKQFIDGMRTARDTKMAELNALKAQLKEQNQRLLQVTQERAKIESKNKVNQRKMEDGVGKFIISELYPNPPLTIATLCPNFKWSFLCCSYSRSLLLTSFLTHCFPCLELPEPEPYEIRNNFSYLSSLSAHCVKSLVPEGK